MFPAALGAALSTLGIYSLGRVMLEFPSLFISRTSYIYGSLAAVPLLLLMIYLIWIVILYGAAVAFIYQRLYHARADGGVSAEAASPFHRVERDVLAVLRAAHDLSGSEAAGGRRAVPLGTLAVGVGLRDAYVESLTYPLVDLGYLARRKVRSGPVYAPRVPLEQVDLAALHALLIRLDPTGRGQLRALNALDEFRHTLGTLYASDQPAPPLFLGDVAGDRREAGT